MTATRIQISRRTARWDDAAVRVGDAMDFWSFAAGAANVVMQMSRPGVGHGVAESTVESGSLMKHPWKRARTTFQYLAVAVFGDEGDRPAYREAVNAPPAARRCPDADTPAAPSGLRRSRWGSGPPPAVC